MKQLIVIISFLLAAAGIAQTRIPGNTIVRGTGGIGRHTYKLYFKGGRYFTDDAHIAQSGDTTWFPLAAKVRIVKANPDFRLRHSRGMGFPNLRVHWTDKQPKEACHWQHVDSLEDFTVQFFDEWPGCIDIDTTLTAADAEFIP